MNTKPLLNILVVSLAGIVGAIAARPAMAQSQTEYQSQTQQPPVYQSNETDPTKGQLGGFDPMSLIHNANLSRSRNGNDFAEDSQRNLSKAAADFKKMQQQQLQQNSEPSQPSSSTTKSLPASP
jgi:hypothetical protein